MSIPCDKCKLEVIVPIYNDAANIEPLAQAISSITPEIEARTHTHFNVSILFIDDGSDDETWNTINDTKELYMQSDTISTAIRGIKLSRNFGKERALAAGLEQANGDVFAVMDSDLQHPPELLPELLASLQTEGIDVVDAVKRDRGCERGIHRFFANSFYAIMSAFSGMDMKGASDYKVFTKKAMNAWRQLSEKNLFFRGMATWIGMQHASVPFNVGERDNGASKWSSRDLISLATTAITAYSTIPLKVISIVGFLFVIFSVLLSLQTLYVYLSGGAVTGFSTVILILLTSSGLIMISLGVIGEYIARIYDETKGRPRYIVSEET